MFPLNHAVFLNGPLQRKVLQGDFKGASRGLQGFPLKGLPKRSFLPSFFVVRAPFMFTRETGQAAGFAGLL